MTSLTDQNKKPKTFQIRYHVNEDHDRNGNIVKSCVKCPLVEAPNMLFVEKKTCHKKISTGK